MIRNRVAQKNSRSGQQPRHHRTPLKLSIGYLVGALAPLLMVALTLASRVAEDLLPVVAPGLPF